MKVVLGGGRLKCRPEKVDHLLPVHAVAGREREELDERRGLAQAPIPFLECSIPDRHVERAEHLNAERAGDGSRGVLPDPRRPCGP